MPDNFDQLDKLSQKHRLTLELHRLIAPLDVLGLQPEPPRLPDYHGALAQYQAGLARFFEHARRLTTFSDVHIATIYDPLYTELQNLYNQTRQVLSGMDPEEREARQRHIRLQLEVTHDRVLALLDMIPTTMQATLFEAQTPFTVHLRIEQVVTGARRRVHYFDRYLAQDFFALYLAYLDRALEVRLITTAGQGGGKRPSGIAGVQAVSDLFRQEASNYQLIQVPPQDLHGRYLRVDDQIYTLDVGTADAGKYPTHFGLGDSSINAHHILDSIIAAGTVIHTS